MKKKKKKKKGFNGNVKVFSVNYNPIDTKNLLDSQRYS